MQTTFSKMFESKLISEIEELFDKLDFDKNKYLTADELLLVLK